ncbi:hypothetical protein ACKS0A_01636 [Histoplasma ohiense]
MEHSASVLLNDPDLRDNPIDKCRRCNIKRRVPHANPISCNRDSFHRPKSISFLSSPRPPNPGDLLLGPFLNNDIRTGLRIHIDGRPRRRDEELDSVVFRQHGQAVCPDLVGRVAVGGHTVCSDDYGAYAHTLSWACALAREEGRGHVVCDEGGGDIVVDELECGETGALVVRAGFCAVGTREGPSGV